VLGRRSTRLISGECQPDPGELKAELKSLSDAFVALASAAPTPAAPHDDELQAQLREICSLLKATLRIQPQALLPPLPLPAAF
jgi:hypothetical protein